MLTTHAWLSLVAGAGHLALAILALFALSDASRRGALSDASRRGGRRTPRKTYPLALPLALLCTDLFAWNLAAVAYEVTRQSAWHWLDVGLSPFTPPLALHLAVSFVGRSRRLRRLLVAAYVVFGALAVSSAVPSLRPWWDWAYVALETPVIAFALGLLVLHLRKATDELERSRTRMMIAAFAIAAVLGPTELVDGWVGLPALGNLGTLVATLLVATVALRFRLLGRELSMTAALYALFLATVGVAGGVAVFRWIGQSTAMVALGAATFAAAVLAATRELVAVQADRRERVAEFATLGRFSSQMAHDLKNPLATLKGALQFLKEEQASGRSLDAQHEFLDVMLEQVDRLHRVVDEYQRVGRVQPVPRAVDLNSVVKSVLALEGVTLSGAAAPVAVKVELEESLPTCELDADLLSGALHNLLRNAIEAMPQGGTLTVRTQSSGATGGNEVLLSVEDSGEGMDARHAERAFDDFYTTKPQGSGLGLAFVRRVAHAHGGEVSLKSRVGVGTTVVIRLPSSGL